MPKSNRKSNRHEITVPNICDNKYDTGADARFTAFFVEYLTQFGYDDVVFVDTNYGVVVQSSEWQFTVLTSGRQDGKTSVFVGLTEVDGSTKVLCNELVSSRDGLWCRKIEESIEGYIMKEWRASGEPFEYNEEVVEKVPTIPVGATLEMEEMDMTVRTPEQRAAVMGIVNNSMFKFACMNPFTAEVGKYKGKFAFLFYGKDDELYCAAFTAKGKYKCTRAATNIPVDIF